MKQMRDADKRYKLRRKEHPESIGLGGPRPQFKKAARPFTTVYDIRALAALPTCKAIKAIEQELVRIYGI